MTDRKHKEFGAKRVMSEDEVDQVRRLAGFLTMDQMAQYFGLTRAQFDTMIRENEEIDAAYRQGRAAQISGVAQTLVNKALEGDTQCLIFYLKTQGKWSEKIDVEIKGEVTLASALREMAVGPVIDADRSDLGPLPHVEPPKALPDQRFTDEDNSLSRTPDLEDVEANLLKRAQNSARGRRRHAARRKS